LSHPTKTDSRLAIEAAFSLTAIRISVLRRDMGRIIFRTTDNFARSGALDGASPVSDQTPTILSKKKLAMAFDFRHTSRSCGDNQSS